MFYLINFLQWFPFLFVLAYGVPLAIWGNDDRRAILGPRRCFLGLIGVGVAQLPTPLLLTITPPRHNLTWSFESFWSNASIAIIGATLFLLLPLLLTRRRWPPSVASTAVVGTLSVGGLAIVFCMPEATISGLSAMKGECLWKSIRLLAILGLPMILGFSVGARLPLLAKPAASTADR